MTIEFSCSHCNKVLKTSDDKAGRRAKCPQCGEAVTVPMPDVPASEDDGFDEFDAPVPEESSFLGEQTVSEEESFLAGSKTVCPMCGEDVPAGAVKCEYCGETLKASSGSGRGAWEPRVFNISDTFSRAWELYKANLGLAIAIPLVAGSVYMVASSVIGFFMQIIQVSIMQAGGRGEGTMVAIFLLLLLQNAMVFLVYMYFQLGGQIVFLKIVRGENPEFNELFSGGPYLGRMILCSIVYGLVVLLGYVALIIPGIIFSLMFWPFSFILIDRNLPGLDSFTKAKDVMVGNKLSFFGLSLLLGLITLVGGVVTLFFGLIFIIPFTYMVQTVAYAEMTNQ
ncbi:Double zinc ribbon [Gimesia panareensis]|uniref:Double zinc ribbon n=2 Tax=Gimesia panareensis TaxID=2527978 RepID=A0A517Q2Y6_9PLAN|nr:Double zinc ribbon [Gimesia panareensis]